jgi:glutamate formiminotransferase
VLECVVNLSEGRDLGLLDGLRAEAGPQAVDVHADPDHHRSVFTLLGEGSDVEAAVRSLTRAAISRLDIGRHAGVHPRRGIVDVVPFVDLAVGRDGRVVDGTLVTAAAARDRYAHWAAETLALPCFLYGPGDDGTEVTLPELRREAWKQRMPDVGPHRAHPTAGAVCVGARKVLVAYNLWLAEADLVRAKEVAAEVRRPGLRTLGLQVGERVQVSCNLIDPWHLGPADAFDAVASRVALSGAELVGLLPLAVLDAVPASRWDQLGIHPSSTIAARLVQAGLDGGRFPSGS